jgi:hypothetical protein
MKTLITTVGLLVILAAAATAQEKKTAPPKNQLAQKDSAEALVKFKPDAKEEEIKALASEIGMLQVKQIKELNLRVFRFPANKKMEDVIRPCEKKPFVVYAEANKNYQTKNK